MVTHLEGGTFNCRLDIISDERASHVCDINDTRGLSDDNFSLLPSRLTDRVEVGGGS